MYMHGVIGFGVVFASPNLAQKLIHSSFNFCTKLVFEARQVEYSRKIFSKLLKPTSYFRKKS